MCFGLNLLNSDKNIESNQLVVIVEGTYLRCEKALTVDFNLIHIVVKNYAI